MEANIIGDNGLIIESDFSFEEFGEDLLPKIKMMPKLDMQIINESQYTDVRYYTGCTIMSGINAFATINNFKFTKEQIASVYDLAETRGRKPGNGWSRGEGWLTVSKRWNEQFPINKSLIFTVALFSDEFDIIMEKLGIIGISISVDSKYWKDVRDNLVVDGSEFALSMGHATCMMYNNNKYFCVDSVSQNYTNKINEGMLYIRGPKAKIEELKTAKNIRNDCHIVIMEKRLRGISEEEKERLLKFKVLLEEAISTNSKLWELTTTEEEKNIRKKQNDYNRAKLAVVNGLLS